MSVGIVRGVQKGEWVSLNVGGKIFKTTRSTLCNDPDSILSKMFSEDSEVSSSSPINHLPRTLVVGLISVREYGDTTLFQWGIEIDENGHALLDADPRYFNTILNYLRMNEVCRPLCIEGVPPLTLSICAIATPCIQGKHACLLASKDVFFSLPFVR